MDVVSDVLSTVQMRGAFFFHATNYAPCLCGEPTIAFIGHRVMPDADFVIPFHIMLQGSCWVDVLGETSSTLHLESGDVVVFPKGDAHFMMSEPGLRVAINPADFDPPPGRRQPMNYVVNGERCDSVDCLFICGFFGCDARPFNPLLDALPRMFRVRTPTLSRELLTHLAQVGVNETERESVGGSTMLAKLADLMFVEVLRQQIDQLTDESRGWLAGLRDRQVGAALGLIHESPTEPWTLEILAQKVGLSRSVFAARFVKYVGIPAIQYLAQWRLTLATRLLDDKTMSIAQAGAEVGYESEAAFNRAFKKYVGTTPGSWRRERRVMLPAAAE